MVAGVALQSSVAFGGRPEAVLRGARASTSAPAVFPYGHPRPRMRDFFLDYQRAHESELPPEKPVGSFRVVSHNINEFHSIERSQRPIEVQRRVELELRASGADIIALQEVPLDQRTLGELQQAFGDWKLLHCASSAHGGGATGNVLLTRLSVRRVENVTLPGYHDPRCAVIATVDLPAGDGAIPVVVIATHLDNDDEGASQKAALGMLFELVKAARNTILVGDLNLVISSDPQLRMFEAIDRMNHRGVPIVRAEVFEKAGFVDAAAFRPDGPPPWTCWSGKRVDYIYFKNGGSIIEENSGVLYSQNSDHMPVFFDFKELRKPSADPNHPSDLPPARAH